MKIKVKDIEPNPFRDFDRNPVQKDKVEALKASISDTGFWDNIVVRPYPNQKGKFQLAYGHHRLSAVQGSGIEYVDIPCRDIDDAAMLKMMAAENMSDWRVTPAVITEAVWAAKQFLDEKLDKCETFQELESELHQGQAQKLFSGIPEEKVYQKVRSEGVGAVLIVRLLGDGWDRPVSEALSALQEDSARAQAERLRKRQEREAAKAEAARQEAARQEQLRVEAEERARKEAEEAERLRLEAEERAKAEAIREAERKAEEARLAEERRKAEEERKAREAEEKARAAAESKAIAEAKAAEAAAKKAAAEAKAEADRVAAEAKRKELEAQRKAQEAKAAEEAAERERARKEQEEKDRIAKAEQSKRQAELEAERRKAQEEKAKADKLAKEAAEAKAKAAREAKLAEDAKKAAEEEARNRARKEKQAADKALAHEREMQKLEKDGIDRKAFELFEVRKHAESFSKAVILFKVPREKHFLTAQTIIKKFEGQELTGPAITAWIHDYAKAYGYIKEAKAKPKFEDVKFDALCIGVAERLNSANKELRRILGEVNKILGYEKSPDVYYLHDYFLRANARNQLKKELDSIMALAKSINLDPLKTAAKNVTPVFDAINVG